MVESPLNILRVRMPLWLVMLFSGFVLFLGLGGGLLAGRLLFQTHEACPESPEVCREFAVFWETWDLARDNYVDTKAVVPDQMIAGAVNGMLNSLGDEGHTRFLTAQEAEDWDKSLRGSYEGIGAYIDVREGRAIIVEPIEGSPAEQAGLRPGDEIVEVDGISTRDWTVDELAARVSGPRGTSVTLLVLHAGEQQAVEMTIKRATIDLPSVMWRMLPDQIALIKLNAFNDNAGDDLKAALEAAQAQGARAIMLDLRNNPGGLLDEAVNVTSQFLPEGTPVLLEANREGKREATETKSGGVALQIPLVVLVNQNTASSAEIVTGALQDAKRATVVGEATFGTGTVLTPYRLRDGSRLLLGTEQWLTPSGRQIRGEGLTPDVVVALPEAVAPVRPSEIEGLSIDQLLNGTDVQLARALELARQAAMR